MIYKISDNILSPLGDTTEMNYRAVIDGKTRLRRHENIWGIRESFIASLFDSEQAASIHKEGLTFFEAAVIRSVRQALSTIDLDISRKDIIFILSTTKANIALLDRYNIDSDSFYPGVSAERITHFLGMTTTPIVVCNACISGLEAIILAQRLLDRKTYDYAIVCGADMQSRFIVSGFMSLKALSPSECRPFDIERTGLNLGEAAATMIFSHKATNGNDWLIQTGSVRNDAVHISTPSKKGEGLKRALLQIMKEVDKNAPAVINAHGTGTLFNDQMEAVAIREAGLADIPVDALKGYYGHTMGASGILETILTMRALDDGIVLGTRGFEELGVSVSLSLSSRHRTTDKRNFIKTLSGFGGCNAAVLAKKGKASETETSGRETAPTEMHRVTITPKTVVVDGRQIQLPDEGTDLLTFLYHQYVDDYPKFYKMDKLCRLGFIASELLLNAEALRTPEETDNRAVVLFNRSSSICADRKYLQSIKKTDDYYPSPSAFVYTLPNIVTGEIAIRNHYHGQTSFYILPIRDDRIIRCLQKAAATDTSIQSMISGWVDYENDNQFIADIYLLAIK